MSDPRDIDGLVTFNNDEKFDFQRKRANGDELECALRLFEGSFEHKCERHQPWLTGNLCIERRRRGFPSGLTVTEAANWAHELRYNEELIATLVIPVPVLWKLTRHYENDPVRNNRFFNGGDDGVTDGVLIPIGPLRHWGRIVGGPKR
jgi:hypothetical protein